MKSCLRYLYIEDFAKAEIYREAMIGKFWKIRSFGRRERAVLVKTVLLIPCVAVGLRILGCKRCMRLLAQCTNARKEPARPMDAARLMELTHLAAVHHPIKATCLIESLTTWFLLQRAGIRARIHIAFRNDQGLQGHAWVELAGIPDEEPIRSSHATSVLTLEPPRPVPSRFNAASMRIPMTEGEE